MARGSDSSLGKTEREVERKRFRVIASLSPPCWKAGTRGSLRFTCFAVCLRPPQLRDAAGGRGGAWGTGAGGWRPEEGWGGAGLRPGPGPARCTLLLGFYLAACNRTPKQQLKQEWGPRFFR